MGSSAEDIEITLYKHDYEVGDILLISGNKEYEGKWIVHKVSNDTFNARQTVTFGKTRRERRSKNQVVEKYYRKFDKRTAR